VFDAIMGEVYADTPVPFSLNEPLPGMETTGV
jgi:hypothetical protein